MNVYLALLGSISGVVYAGLGLAALKHLPSADETDRVAGWTLWWCLEAKRYTAAGKRLCALGGGVLAVGVGAWIAAVRLGA